MLRHLTSLAAPRLRATANALVERVRRRERERRVGAKETREVFPFDGSFSVVLLTSFPRPRLFSNQKHTAGPAAATRGPLGIELLLFVVVCISISGDDDNESEERGSELRFSFLQQRRRQRQQLPPPLCPRRLLESRGLPRSSRRGTQGIQAHHPRDARPRHHLPEKPLEGLAAQAARRRRGPQRRAQRDGAGDRQAPRRGAPVGPARGRLLEGASS